MKRAEPRVAPFKAAGQYLSRHLVAPPPRLSPAFERTHSKSISSRALPASLARAAPAEC